MKIFATAIIFFASLIIATSSPASAISSDRNCDANAMVYCGALTTAELRSKLQRGDGQRSGAELSKLFTNRGISSNQIRPGSVVNGEVTKDGTVTVGSKVVATNAHSLGRQYITGSVRDGGLWARPTSVSLNSDSLPAFVRLDKNGVFQWAIIKSCGNIVKATPKAADQPQPAPQPTPPPPVQTPAQTQIQTQTQAQTVVVHVKPAPIEKVVYRTTPVQTPAPLPQTGFNPLAGMFAIGSISLGLSTYLRSRQKLFWAIKHKER